MGWALAMGLLSLLFTLLMSGVVLHTLRAEWPGAESDLLRRVRAAEDKIGSLTEAVIAQELQIEALRGARPATGPHYAAYYTAPQYAYTRPSWIPAPKRGGDTDAGPQRDQD